MRRVIANLTELPPSTEEKQEGKSLFREINEGEHQGWHFWQTEKSRTIK